MIAVPVAAADIGSAVAQIEKANAVADMIELRLDYLKELGSKDLERLIKKCGKPVICTCRRMEEGGRFMESETKRIAVLKNCVKLKADYVDLEFETGAEQKKKFFEYAKKHKSKIILSKHYFGHTPQFEDLLKLMLRMQKEKPDVIKIVAKANSHEDNKIMFELLKEAKRRGIKLIAFCMGSIGRDSRILSMPLGGFLTFASLEKGGESADGQIPIEEMKKIYSGLRVMF
ncbi:MAG: type I 3-dehydroquinate dehydratase [archaeon]